MVAGQGLRHVLPARPVDRDRLDTSRSRRHDEVNGEVKQDGRTYEMVHSVPALIEYIIVVHDAAAG